MDTVTGQKRSTVGQSEQSMMTEGEAKIEKNSNETFLSLKARGAGV